MHTRLHIAVDVMQVNKPAWYTSKFQLCAKLAVMQGELHNRSLVRIYRAELLNTSLLAFKDQLQDPNQRAQVVEMQPGDAPFQTCSFSLCSYAFLDVDYAAKPSCGTNLSNAETCADASCERRIFQNCLHSSCSCIGVHLQRGAVELNTKSHSKLAIAAVVHWSRLLFAASTAFCRIENCRLVRHL